MPGKKITDHQVQKYKHHHLKLSQAAAAAKAGISERSARRIERSDALPSQREERAWRTRADPLAAVWDSEIVPLLEADAALSAVTLLEELQRRYPGNYGTANLRTLQRRVRQWLSAPRRICTSSAGLNVPALLRRSSSDRRH